MSWDEFCAANRRNWDERVAIHRRDATGFYAIERFLAGDKRLHALLALRWTLSNPVIGTALVGFRTPSEVAENLGALGWEISNVDMAEIDAVLARHGAVSVPSGWLED
jgi:aryl-alcohol dehydrogenase-like predicted oxidoreductase